MVMSNVPIDRLVRSLAQQSPSLLICIVGMALALTFWRRCPLPSLLTLIGLGLRLATTLVNIIVFEILVVSNNHGLFQLVGFIAQVFNVIGLGLLLAAVFVGRSAKSFD
jgi:hypothetical protein